MGIFYPLVKRWLPYAMSLMLFACGGGGGGEEDTDAFGTNDPVAVANSTVPDNVFTATLGSAQQIPSNSSTATGIGVVMIDPASRMMRASLTTAGIAGTAAHIRIAPTGTAGPIVFPLTETPAGSGIWSMQATLTEEQLTTLRNGNYYFNVGSTAFPEGEIRGQIVRQLPGSGIKNTVTNSVTNTETDTGGTGINTNSVSNGSFIDGGTGITGAVNPTSTTGGNIPAAITTGTTIGPAGLDTGGTIGNAASPGTITGRTTFVNVLTGTQQVPASGSNAVAIGVAIVDPASQTMVTSITSIGISGISAHIHQAASGSNGGVIFALNETAVGSGIWAARLAVSESQLNAFAGGSYYFDIHTTAFPNGEIRGQIVASRSTGNFGIGSSEAGSRGTGTVTPAGVTTDPFVPGSITGTIDTDNTITGASDASVPTFGNPAGSGIGSGTSTSFNDSSVPTFGNPIGSGIGIDIGSGTSTGFTGSTSSVPSIGTGMNPATSGNTTDALGTGGFGTSTASTF